MTPAEVGRYVESRQRVMKREAKEQAARDWTLADLIGRSVSRLYSKDARMPEIWEAYPTLFGEVFAQRMVAVGGSGRAVYAAVDVGCAARISAVLARRNYRRCRYEMSVAQPIRSPQQHNIRHVFIPLSGNSSCRNVRTATRQPCPVDGRSLCRNDSHLAPIVVPAREANHRAQTAV